MNLRLLLRTCLSCEGPSFYFFSIVYLSHSWLAGINWLFFRESRINEDLFLDNLWETEDLNQQWPCKLVGDERYYEYCWIDCCYEDQIISIKIISLRTVISSRKKTTSVEDITQDISHDVEDDEND